jgi:hypothetical protein
MEKKTITIELNEWQLEQIRTIINALKDFNRATDEKCDIDYSIVRTLDGADSFLGNHFGLVQPQSESGNRRWWADYKWIEEEDEEEED